MLNSVFQAPGRRERCLLSASFRSWEGWVSAMPVKVGEEGVPFAPCRRSSQQPTSGWLRHNLGVCSSPNEEKPLRILTRSVCSLIYSAWISWCLWLWQASSRSIIPHIYRYEEGSYKNCNLYLFWLNSTFRSPLKPGKQLVLESSLCASVFLWFLKLPCEWLTWACWMFHITKNFLQFNPKSHVPPKNLWDISTPCIFCMFLTWVVWFLWPLLPACLPLCASETMPATSLNERACKELCRSEGHILIHEVWQSLQYVSEFLLVAFSWQAFGLLQKLVIALSS